MAQMIMRVAVLSGVVFFMSATLACAQSTPAKTRNATSDPTVPPAAAADRSAPANASSERHERPAKPMPSPHRNAEAGRLTIVNKQTRTFTLECETCAPEAKARVYQAPTAMNLHALDGKRVLVTFDSQGSVQTVRRIDARRRVSTGKRT